MSKRLRLSHSAVELFLLCPRKFYIKNIEGVEPVTEDRRMVFGNVFHKALEAWWGHDSGATRLQWALETWYAEASRKRLLPEEALIGQYLLIAYDALQQKEFGEILAEQRVTVSVHKPGGELDPELELKIIQDTVLTDQMVGMEHKTTSMDINGDFYWQKVKGQQADIYFIVAQDSGQALRFLLWDVIHVPQFRRLKATPEDQREYYQRDGKYGKKGDLKPGSRDKDETWEEFEARVSEEISSNPTKYFRQEKLFPDEPSVESTRYDIWATGRLMLEAIRQEAFPRNRQSCGAYGRRCEYAPICFEGVDPQQSQLYTIRKPPHPLRDV